MIHKLSNVLSKNIGENTQIWQFSVVLEGAKIGSNCNINCHTFIENNVIIGDNVTVKAGVYLWDGIIIEDNVFIGPNVTFTNDSKPRSKVYPKKFQKTIIKSNASIGASSIILGGVEIGSYCMVGAGALVTKSVPSRALVVGSPANIVAWLDDRGNKMIFENGFYSDIDGNLWKLSDNELIQIEP